ncbi:uncharacterized protein LOC110454471, partial [Mizuhopecten yessoensis]|uniref:uncharacterized protein LOC110454471 n=1 Tax=Mizuhopecten yessoensis TaxID=6573 RepID=UPI000B459522
PCSPTSKSACCIHGSPYTDGIGKQLFCGRGPNSRRCPKGYSCFTNAVDLWAVCCSAKKVTPEPCSPTSKTACCIDGSPYTDGNGKQLFCGRGPNSRRCPKDYSCFTNAVDLWAVCCSAKKVTPGTL